MMKRKTMRRHITEIQEEDKRRDGKMGKETKTGRETDIVRGLRGHGEGTGRQN